MSVLITGGASFIGSNFVIDWLSIMNKAVSNLDKLTYANNLTNLEHDVRHTFVQGEVFDVAVDIRRSSPIFVQWVGETLPAENKKQLWIPKIFVHRFFTFSKIAEFLYKATDYFVLSLKKTSSGTNPHIRINWLTSQKMLLRDKDASVNLFS